MVDRAPVGFLEFCSGLLTNGPGLLYESVTGVQTFMVSHDGVVYQKDLGPDTVKLANAIERFNPDKTWTPVLEQ